MLRPGDMYGGSLTLRLREAIREAKRGGVNQRTEPSPHTRRDQRMRRTLVINSNINVPEENCNSTVDRARWPLRASLRDTLCKHPPSPETRLPPPDRPRSLPTRRTAVACSCNKLMRQLRPCGRGCGGVSDSRAALRGGGRGRRSGRDVGHRRQQNHLACGCCAM